MRSRFRSAICATLLSTGVCSQILRNGDFTLGCDTCSTRTAFWDLSWAGRKVDVARVEGALRIACLDSADAVGFVEQSVHMDPTTETTMFTITAKVRVDRLRGKGASLNLACYDAAGGFLWNKDMGLLRPCWIHGTKEARPYTLKLILPLGTACVKVGAIVNGRGEAWFDDFHATMNTLAGRGPDDGARSYVAAVCDTIQRHALYRDSTDIGALRATALMIAGDQGDATDHQLAAEYLLQGLGDHHSFLMRPDAYLAWQHEEEADEAAFTYATHRIVQGYGYILVPAFQSGDTIAMQQFADSLQQALGSMEQQGAAGWIVDLRTNTGGNMAPMIAGLGPLFDPGVLGVLVDTHGSAERWSYRDGVYAWDDIPALRVHRPLNLRRKLPIAVLTGQRTGSSGECVAISFIGNSRTRSFGQATWGLTTGNGQYALPDGAQMFMASTIMGDRTGRSFHGPIAPDLSVDQPAGWEYDAAFDAALKWLGTQR